MHPKRLAVLPLTWSTSSYSHRDGGYYSLHNTSISIYILSSVPLSSLHSYLLQRYLICSTSISPLFNIPLSSTIISLLLYILITSTSIAPILCIFTSISPLLYKVISSLHTNFLYIHITSTLHPPLHDNLISSILHPSLLYVLISFPLRPYLHYSKTLSPLLYILISSKSISPLLFILISSILHTYLPSCTYLFPLHPYHLSPLYILISSPLYPLSSTSASLLHPYLLYILIFLFSFFCGLYVYENTKKCFFTLFSLKLEFFSRLFLLHHMFFSLVCVDITRQ